MSQRILRALMQLFSLISSPSKQIEDKKKIVESFLSDQLNKEQVEEYLKIYYQFVAQYKKRESNSNPQKTIAVSSVKVLTICSIINEELTQQQKIILIIKLLEFIKTDENITTQTQEFIKIVAESFKLDKDEFTAINNFIFKNKTLDPERVLSISSTEKDPEKINHLTIKGLKGEIYALYIKTINTIIFYISGEKEVYLNQQLLTPFRTYVLSYGSAIRTNTTQPIYYNDIRSIFSTDKNKTNIIFEADKITYKFKNNKIGIQPLSITERSGRLVGIMGGSGSGKTTLLNLLNGNFKPTTGHIFINGIDLNKNKNKLNGLIGYVSQDDLLIEELTVFENLYFNAKLCFANNSEYSIKFKVIQTLKELGLYEIKDMKVGSVLNRKISGGQRKRLNIALELIREPPILFLDEPTSGLSSRDSENIMDLLKGLTLKGKIIFVVIHQPSSAIFKMFDRLIVLDQGGYLIYNGKPIEAILFFKSAIRQADWNDTVCQICGNINSEQIFNIIETRVLDEYGKQTQTRKFSPKDWYLKFIEYNKKHGRKRSYLVHKIPTIPFNVPSTINQFKVFVKRDLLTKLSNLQYLIINTFETPVMAFILAYIIKYKDINNENGYQLFLNENLPVYIFMTVIIATFVGLTVAAQEIYKDKKILKRERFLNLSRFSYLLSKTFNMSIISAYQSLIFVIIANKIIGVSFLNIYYWLILFSIWISANMLGLIISEASKSSATIYIIIPFLVIPQIILSGVLVPFNKLNPNISDPYSIPIYGEIMTTRWGYEAIVVKQFRDNPYMKMIYPYEKTISQANYVKHYWCKAMKNNLDIIKIKTNNPEKKRKTIDAITLLRNEFSQNHKWTTKIPYNFNPKNITYSKITPEIIDSISKYIKTIEKYYIKLENAIIVQKDNKINNYNNENKKIFSKMKMQYHNDKLEQFVAGITKDRITQYKGKLYRLYKPIFHNSEKLFLKAHFYAPNKPFFNHQIDTFWFNLIVIWCFSIILFLILYYKILQRIVNLFNITKKKYQHNTLMENIEDEKKTKKRKFKFLKFFDRFS